MIVMKPNGEKKPVLTETCLFYEFKFYVAYILEFYFGFIIFFFSRKIIKTSVSICFEVSCKSRKFECDCKVRRSQDPLRWLSQFTIIK